MRTFTLFLIFMLFTTSSFGESPFMFSSSKGFMLGGRPQEQSSGDVKKDAPIHIPAPVKSEKPIIMQQPVDLKQVEAEQKTPDAQTVTSNYSTAQSFAIRAGLPTFVSTFYNPDMTLRNLSWSTAALSGALAGVVGVGFEMYDEHRNDGVINYTRVAQTGGLLGGATFTGVMVGQMTQRVLLINSYALAGIDSSSVGAQMFSGFMGDFLGSSAASAVYASGAYALGWIDGADARTAMAKGVTGSVILAAGKTVGTQALFMTFGTSGAVATFGPYAITYLAAVGAVYLTDVIFQEIDKQEKNELLGKTIISMMD